jgi:hypothetical protein
MVCMRDERAQSSSVHSLVKTPTLSHLDLARRAGMENQEIRITETIMDREKLC